MDHTQIKPFDARRFLNSSEVIPCFRMVALENSVHESGDVAFQRNQVIYRKPHWAPVDKFII